MKFAQNMDMGYLKVDPDGQGHRSKSRGQKILFEASFDRLTDDIEDQGSHGPGSKVLRVKISQKVKGLGYQVKNLISHQLLEMCLVQTHQ